MVACGTFSGALTQGRRSFKESLAPLGRGVARSHKRPAEKGGRAAKCSLSRDRSPSLRGAIATKQSRFRTSRLDCFADARNDEAKRSRDACTSESLLTTTTQNRLAPGNKEGAERRKAHANHFRRANKRLAPLIRVGADARHFGARSPSGTSLRLSPGRTHPPLAQLQFPRFLRPGLTGVTRFGLSQVYRAPRGPVVMPAERWPRAARERSAFPPPAGTALAPLFRHALRKSALDERDKRACN